MAMQPPNYPVWWLAGEIDALAAMAVARCSLLAQNLKSYQASRLTRPMDNDFTLLD
jgi:hypothetical protein